MEDRKASLSQLILAFVLSVLAVVGVFKLTTVDTMVVNASGGGGAQVPVSLPWEFKHLSDAATVNVTYQAQYFSPTVWRIVPDDHLVELKINSIPYDLSIHGGAVHDYRKGFLLDLSSRLESGQSLTLDFKLRNTVGPGGLKIEPQRGWFYWFCIGLSFLPFIIVAGRYFSVTREQLLLMVGAMVPIMFYWSQTPWDVRAYDVGGGGGHYDYIAFIFENQRIPEASEGWIFYHPPFYYLLCLPFYAIADFLGLAKAEMVRVSGMFLWIIFLASSLAALKVVLRHRVNSLIILSALIVFWPSGVIHSVRIGNDILYYSCCGVAFYLLARWLERPSLGLVVKLGIAAGASFLAKNNGLLIIAGVGLIVMINLLRENKLFSKTTIVQLFSLGGVSLIALLAGYYKRIFALLIDSNAALLVGNGSTLNSALLVDNSLKAYIPFDGPTYFLNAYTNTWDDEFGRNNFWNFLFKSSYTGEFFFEGDLTRLFAYLMGISGLAIWAASIAGMFRGGREAFKVGATAIAGDRLVVWPWAVFGLLFLIGEMIFRYSMPYGCSNDFRYIFPIIVPMAIVLSQYDWAKRWILLFTMSSVLFFIAHAATG